MANTDDFVSAKLSEGWADEELGDVQGFGYYAFLRGPLEADENDIKEFELDSDDVEWLLEQKAIIAHEDNQGFLDVDGYTSLGQAKEDWANLEDQYEEFESSVE